MFDIQIKNRKVSVQEISESQYEEKLNVVPPIYKTTRFHDGRSL